LHVCATLNSFRQFNTALSTVTFNFAARERLLRDELYAEYRDRIHGRKTRVGAVVRTRKHARGSLRAGRVLRGVCQEASAGSILSGRRDKNLGILRLGS
jgi:hypothetical protein